MPRGGWNFGLRGYEKQGESISARHKREARERATKARAKGQAPNKKGAAGKDKKGQ